MSAVETKQASWGIIRYAAGKDGDRCVNLGRRTLCVERTKVRLRS